MFQIMLKDKVGLKKKKKKNRCTSLIQTPFAWISDSSFFAVPLGKKEL